jgi:hypothetical protein
MPARTPTIAMMTASSIKVNPELFRIVFPLLKNVWRGIDSKKHAS